MNKFIDRRDLIVSLAVLNKLTNMWLVVFCTQTSSAKAAYIVSFLSFQEASSHDRDASMFSYILNWFPLFSPSGFSLVSCSVHIFLYPI